MLNQIIIMSVLVLSGVAVKAGEIIVGNYEILSSNPEILKLVKEDVCAQATVDSMKKYIFDQAAMENGEDLPESVQVEFLARLGHKPEAVSANYSVSARVNTNDSIVSKVVLTQRSGNRCTAGKPVSVGI